MILAIYGSGGAGKESLQNARDIIDDCKAWEDIVFIDDTKPAGEFKGYKIMPYVDFTRIYNVNDVEIHIALGELVSKKKLAVKVKKDGYTLASLIHPTATIGNNVKLSSGIQIKMKAIIGDDVSLGECTWVQAYAFVGNETNIGDYCQISAKANIEEKCDIGTMSFVGMHANIAKHISIGENCVVAMGAFVRENIKKDIVCMGNPARPFFQEKEHTIF